METVEITVTNRRAIAWFCIIAALAGLDHVVYNDPHSFQLILTFASAPGIFLFLMGKHEK